MIRLNIKPLSVNSCYNTQRTKSSGYHAFEKEVILSLPGGIKFEAPYLKLVLTFGVSNRGSDLDNLNKCLIDCLAKKYSFNDNRIMEIHSYKKITEKGSEYMEIQIIPIYE